MLGIKCSTRRRLDEGWAPHASRTAQASTQGPCVQLCSGPHWGAIWTGSAHCVSSTLRRCRGGLKTAQHPRGDCEGFTRLHPRHAGTLGPPSLCLNNGPRSNARQVLQTGGATCTLLPMLPRAVWGLGVGVGLEQGSLRDPRALEGGTTHRGSLLARRKSLSPGAGESVHRKSREGVGVAFHAQA